MKFDFTQEPGKKLNNRYKQITEEPVVSIVTAYYNAKKHFKQTFNSVMNQTFPYFEWIIVNDGSTQPEDVAFLEELAKTDSRIRVLHKENGGISTARNLGIKNSKTEIILTIDADDLMAPTYVECLYWTLINNPEASWSYSGLVAFGGANYLWHKEFSSEVEKKENILIVSSAIRKSALMEVDCYSEVEKHYNEDWYLWLRLLGKGHRPVQISQYGFWYRVNDAGVASIVTNDPRVQKANKMLIEEAASKVPDGIRAVTFDGKRGKEFSKPQKWDWNRVLPFKEKKIRILLLLPQMETGGADKFNLDIVSNINKEKYEIGIITTVPAQNDWKQKFSEHVEDIFELPAFLNVSEWSAFIHYYIASRNVDIVFNISSYFGYYTLPWLRKEFPTIRIIDCVHAEAKYWRNGGYPRVSAAVDSVIEKTFVTNGYTRDIMVNKYGKPKEKTEVIYTGVDEEYFNPDKFDGQDIRENLQIAKNRPVVLYLCRIAAEKRPFLMVEIAKEAKQRIEDICFLVVGDGPQIEELRAKVKKEKLEDTIYIVGGKKDIRPYYAACDLSLICSIKEGLAITTFEAMLMKKPVISANVGGQSELVDDSTGRLIECLQDEEKDFDKRTFDSKEVTDYAEAICELLKDNTLLKQMGETCRERIKAGYTLSCLIKTLEQEFDIVEHEYDSKERSNATLASTLLGNLTEELIALYCEYENLQVESRGAYRIMQYVREIISFKKNIFVVIKEIFKQRNNPKVKDIMRRLRLRK